MSSSDEVVVKNGKSHAHHSHTNGKSNSESVVGGGGVKNSHKLEVTSTPSTPGRQKVFPKNNKNGLDNRNNGGESSSSCSSHSSSTSSLVKISDKTNNSSTPKPKAVSRFHQECKSTSLSSSLLSSNHPKNLPPTTPRSRNSTFTIKDKCKSTEVLTTIRTPKTTPDKIVQVVENNKVSDNLQELLLVLEPQEPAPQQEDTLKPPNVNVDKDVILKEDPQTMAGNINRVQVQSAKKQRKHWTLRDRSSMSAHLLKANMAEEGCDEAQLDVAKKLLQDSRDLHLLETARDENARLAVYWLVKSSEQGNPEATRLLEECLESKHGITAQNVIDVKTCLTVPTNEKVTIKAAKLLYTKLSNGEKFITTTQLLASIEDMQGQSEENENTDEDTSLPPNINNFKVGLNETFTLPNGDDGDVIRTSTPIKKDEDREDEEDQKKTEDFWQDGEKLTLEDLIHAAVNFNQGSGSRLAAMREKNKTLERHEWGFLCQLNLFVLHLLIVAGFTGKISVNYCLILGGAFFCLWGCYNLVGWRRRYSNFSDWSKAFKSAGNEKFAWTEKEAESRLVLRSLAPSIAALSISLSVMLFIDGLNTLKLAIGGLVVITLVCQILKRVLPTMRMFAFIVLLQLPKILPVIISYRYQWLGSREAHFQSMIADVTSILDTYGVGLVPVQIVLVGALLLVGNRKALLQKRLPELLASLWICKLGQIAVVEFDNDVVDIGIGLLSSVSLVAFIAILHSHLDLSKLLISLVALSSVYLAFIVLIASSQEESPFKMAISSFRMSHDPLSIKGIGTLEHLPHLEWEEYEGLCHKKAWKASNTAATQLNCFKRYGTQPTAVRWVGKVAFVKVRTWGTGLFKTEDDMTFDITVNILHGGGGDEDTLSSSSWGQWGSEQKSNNDNSGAIPASVLVSTSQIMEAYIKTEIVDFVLNLRIGDRIEFHGILVPSSAGSLKPEIEHLESIKCLQCGVNEEHREFLFHHRRDQQNLGPVHPHAHENPKDEDFNPIQSTSSSGSGSASYYSLKQFLLNLMKLLHIDF